MARTTLDISDPVLRELKRRQKQEKKSLVELASELLTRALAESKQARPKTTPFRWSTWSMGEPSVDLGDKDAV